MTLVNLRIRSLLRGTNKKRVFFRRRLQFGANSLTQLGVVYGCPVDAMIADELAVWLVLGVLIGLVVESNFFRVLRAINAEVKHAWEMLRKAEM